MLCTWVDMGVDMGVKMGANTRCPATCCFCRQDSNPVWDAVGDEVVVPRDVLEKRVAEESAAARAPPAPPGATGRFEL